VKNNYEQSFSFSFVVISTVKKHDQRIHIPQKIIKLKTKRKKQIMQLFYHNSEKAEKRTLQDHNSCNPVYHNIVYINNCIIN